MKEIVGLKTIICARCGKEVIKRPGYPFKIVNPRTGKTVHYCGWDCMRAEERRRKRDKVQKHKNGT